MLSSRGFAGCSLGPVSLNERMLRAGYTCLFTYMLSTIEPFGSVSGRSLRPNVLVSIDMDEQTNAESRGECKASTHTLNKQRLVWIPMGNRRMFIVFLVTLMQCFTVLWSERRQLNTTTMCPNNTFDHRHFPNMHHRFGARSPPEELTTSTSLHDWSIVVVKQ